MVATVIAGGITYATGPCMCRPGGTVWASKEPEADGVSEEDDKVWAGVREILGPSLAARVDRMLEAPELAVTDEDLAALDAFDVPS